MSAVTNTAVTTTEAMSAKCIHISTTTAALMRMADCNTGLFGMMNIFARTLGGVFGDKFGIKFGLVEGHLVALCQPLGADAIDDANTQVWIIWTWPAGSDVRHLYGLDWARAVSD